jgi:hypothetical protein
MLRILPVGLWLILCLVACGNANEPAVPAETSLPISGLKCCWATSGALLVDKTADFSCGSKNFNTRNVPCEQCASYAASWGQCNVLK